MACDSLTRAFIRSVASTSPHPPPVGDAQSQSVSNQPPQLQTKPNFRTPHAFIIAMADDEEVGRAILERVS
jgi:hypothetical protein